MAKTSSRKKAKRKQTSRANTKTLVVAGSTTVSVPNEHEQKAYEARLQRRLLLLRKRFEEGTIRIPNDARITKSLMAMRYASDGSVDLKTVDGIVRSMALAVEGIHERDEAKKVMPLVEIQSTYFGFLEKNFGGMHKEMVKHGANPHLVARTLSRNSETVSELTKSLPGFVEVIEEFWNQTADTAYAHVEDMQNTLKGVFGGDLFPSHAQNIASKCGIYTDTIILPDPFVRSKDLFDKWNPSDRTYYLLKHGLSLLEYRELACADVSPPIVVILPDMGHIRKDERNFMVELGRKDALVHAGKVFGRGFGSIDELMAFARPLDTVDRVMAVLSDKSRVLFNVEWEGSVEEKIARAMEDETTGLFQLKSPGLIIAMEALGRMVSSNEVLLKAQRLQGTPVIDAPTSWQFFAWKLEYDAEKVEKETNLQNLHVVRGLESLAANEMEWLGRVPLKALIELRRTQAMGEIRSILGKGIDAVAQTNPVNFHRTTDRVFDNIQEAFDEHRKKIKQLRDKKWKFAGSDIGTWLVAGTLEVAAAATGLPTCGIAAYAASELLNAPKLRDIPKSVKELARENRELKRSPVGLLFKYSSEKP
jgi:hypothetical protein